MCQDEIPNDNISFFQEDKIYVNNNSNIIFILTEIILPQYTP